ncbi:MULTISPECIES: tyrosine-type recombinase/integrase [unclassified Streptomyces]|uniref:tyrosine-type recombinase/integrase n=2 Tax=unclassified Streptomyces TaxID=2593676 RepID=UPI00224EE884|nr:tyrosine-type recombinase/integrase [Streptomyces sp. NBC_00892]MCX4900867.1 tyrosine-type recombinase/integrase [Streptomyces sp. NBC_00892]WTB51810.1 tyrosine-type recombinase/integrase [Streptomyces sp. NBC_00826]
MRRIVVEDFRVQRLLRAGGRCSYTIVRPDGAVDAEADSYLRTHEGSGSQKTYAYFLVDHLRWRSSERLTTATAEMTDLLRYMGAVGAMTAMPWGQPWRVPPQRPYGQSALQIAAACLKGFYLHSCSEKKVNEELRAELGVQRLPTQMDRSRAMLGHMVTSMPANPLAPRGTGRRRHPKMPPDGARAALLDAVRTARDAMVVTWLSDTSLRIGGLTGLHLVDLHLRENAGCGDCPSPHLHVCHRPGNLNRAAAKIKPDWRVVDGVVCGGEVYRASPAMVSSYFTYMTTEYTAHAAGHGMLLIQLSGFRRGEPWSADAARGMLRRAGRRALLAGRITPKAFRHRFTSAVMDAAPDDPRVAQTAGNWSSARMVDEVYGHPDLHAPEFTAALRTVWGEEE